MQPAATPIMHRVSSFHDLLVWIFVLIVLFVFGLLAYTCWRFSEKRNPVPSRRSHNTLLEIVWTAVPVLILVIIAIPSFKLLYFVDVVPDDRDDHQGHRASVVLELRVSRQWRVHLRRLHDRRPSDLQPDQLRLLEADNPDRGARSKTNVRVQTTATDVIHSWTVPPFGVKVDAVPGRLNELWIKVDEPGTYYGQCSELCGVNHGFMPITVEAVRNGPNSTSGSRKRRRNSPASVTDCE